MKATKKSYKTIYEFFMKILWVFKDVLLGEGDCFGRFTPSPAVTYWQARLPEILAGSQ
jgi:hypothetical protein